jgi:hypothetical protein
MPWFITSFVPSIVFVTPAHVGMLHKFNQTRFHLLGQEYYGQDTTSPSISSTVVMTCGIEIGLIVLCWMEHSNMEQKLMSLGDFECHLVPMHLASQ